MSSGWIITCVLASSGLQGAGAAGADLAAWLQRFGFDDDAVAEVVEGEIAHADLVETDDRELAVAIAGIVSGDLDGLETMLAAGRFLALDESVRLVRPIDPAAVSGSLKAAGYVATETDEIEDLLEVEAGEDFNFAAAEIATWQGLGRRAASRDEVNTALRELLAARFLAYHEGGVAAIAPYVRADDAAVAPGRELARAASADRVRDDAVRALLDAAAGFPAPADGVESRFFWTKQTVDDRPAFTLVHLLTRRTPEMLIAAERHVYASHSYNTFHAVRVMIPVDGGVAILARCRTSTDGIPGFGKTMKRSLGRRRMRKALVAHLEAVKRRNAETPKRRNR